MKNKKLYIIFSLCALSCSPAQAISWQDITQNKENILIGTVAALGGYNLIRWAYNYNKRRNERIRQELIQTAPTLLNDLLFKYRKLLTNQTFNHIAVDTRRPFFTHDFYGNAKYTYPLMAYVREISTDISKINERLKVITESQLRSNFLLLKEKLITLKNKIRATETYKQEYCAKKIADQEVELYRQGNLLRSQQYEIERLKLKQAALQRRIR